MYLGKYPPQPELHAQLLFLGHIKGKTKWSKVIYVFEYWKGQSSNVKEKKNFKGEYSNRVAIYKNHWLKEKTMIISAYNVNAFQEVK